MFGSDPQAQAEKFATQQQSKEMDFSREQQATNIGLQDDQTTMIKQEERKDLIRWQQDMDEELQKLVFKLKRYYLNDRNEWVPKMIMENGKLMRAKPMCNDLFIEEVVEPNCEPYLSKGSTNSNLTEKSILDGLRNTFNDISSTMANNFDRYDISEQDQQSNIIRILKNVLTPAAFRSLNGWTKKTDSTIFRRIEQDNMGLQQQPKKGVMGMFS